MIWFLVEMGTKKIPISKINQSAEEKFCYCLYEDVMQENISLYPQFRELAYKTMISGRWVD